jgi:hypothetical protein
VLVALWSPKGGSGTSVVAAAVAAVLARTTPCRIADLGGDQAAVLGLVADPGTGVLDWLAAGAAVPEALDRLAVEVAPDLVLLPAGGRPGAGSHAAGELHGAEAGGAFAAALRRRAGPTVVDVGVDRSPAAAVVVEAADVALVVLRPCYLALRRAVASPSLAHTSGVVLVDEPGRGLSHGQVTDVLGLPVLGRIPWRPGVARAVDAGVLVARPVDGLDSAVRRLVGRVGLLPTDRGARA